MDTYFTLQCIILFFILSKLNSLCKAISVSLSLPAWALWGCQECALPLILALQIQWTGQGPASTMFELTALAQCLPDLQTPGQTISPAERWSDGRKSAKESITWISQYGHLIWTFSSHVADKFYKNTTIMKDCPFWTKMIFLY